MYTKYFGLKEPSFSITPDPQFLYLSQEHREALAHLIYGAGEGGGFVLLTGEVGTGKTTICRTFLEQLPDEVDAALILKPALSASELLLTICEEFGIGVPTETSSSKLLTDRLIKYLLNTQSKERRPDAALYNILRSISDKHGSQAFSGKSSTKLLIDHLNRYLLDAHAKGRRPILVIDEAQNLKPKLLEVIRLLTNLETDKHKLLQIFLIGQPELRQMLRQKNLRQLAQRITARFHLMPLSSSETADYIGHRLAVAGAERDIFTPAAIRRIYQLSGGVPRLINIICDRALLGAYASRRRQVNRRIVSKSAKELQGGRTLFEKQTELQRIRIGLLLLLLLIVSGWFAWSRHERAAMENASTAAIADISQHSESLKQHKSIDHAQKISSPLIKKRVDTPAELPDVERLVYDERTGMQLLLARWGLAYANKEIISPCDYAKMHMLKCRKISGDWNKLRSYNRPALIKLTDTEGQSGYSLVIGLSKYRTTLYVDGARIDLPLNWLTPYWFGDFILLWRPPVNGTLLITPEASGEIIRWLRKMLSEVPGYSAVDNGSAVYDAALREAVLHFQLNNGLKPDGLVGFNTMILLNNLTSISGVPTLE